jgi:flagellar biogenesis protein FliO
MSTASPMSSASPVLTSLLVTAVSLVFVLALAWVVLRMLKRFSTHQNAPPKGTGCRDRA